MLRGVVLCFLLSKADATGIHPNINYFSGKFEEMDYSWRS
jgi:hypothetical protein